jgi:hypothetical protein
MFIPRLWRRVTLADNLSIADLHRVVQLLMGWDDDHLHRIGFAADIIRRKHGRRMVELGPACCLSTVGPAEGRERAHQATWAAICTEGSAAAQDGMA